MALAIAADWYDINLPAGRRTCFDEKAFLLFQSTCAQISWNSHALAPNVVHFGFHIALSNAVLGCGRRAVRRLPKNQRSGPEGSCNRASAGETSLNSCRKCRPWQQ